MANFSLSKHHSRTPLVVQRLRLCSQPRRCGFNPWPGGQDSTRHMCAVPSLSGVSDSVTPRTIARRLVCPWGLSRQEYWSGLPCPPPGDLPDPRMETRPPALQADSLPSEPPGKSTCHMCGQKFF